jgi:hypothetical protein
MPCHGHAGPHSKRVVVVALPKSRRQDRAQSLLQELPTAPMTEELRTIAIALRRRATDASSRVTSGLTLLPVELGGGRGGCRDGGAKAVSHGRIDDGRAGGHC